ncbi:hypothetical protein BC826DRAFT_995952 [Russula brevipes]|nr:hypothetical protein BC826DRAFT_995952 [Russula brevipes]
MYPIADVLIAGLFFLLPARTDNLFRCPVKRISQPRRYIGTARVPLSGFSHPNLLGYRVATAVIPFLSSSSSWVPGCVTSYLFRQRRLIRYKIIYKSSRGRPTHKLHAVTASPTLLPRWEFSCTEPTSGAHKVAKAASPYLWEVGKSPAASGQREVRGRRFARVLRLTRL